MSKLTDKIIKRRESIQKKAYTLLILVIAGGMGFYTYTKLQDYQSLRVTLAKNETKAETLKEDVAAESAKYSESKVKFDELNSEIEKNLSQVFPLEDNYTVLVRQFDAFEEQLATRSNPFEISNIDFQSPIEGEEYSILPVRMTIRSSAYNFTQFLHLIETSGSLDNEVRLMDISSIRLSFENLDDEEKDKIINFTVQINAYFQ